MKECLEDKLYKDYPKIFVQHSLPMTQTCMNWGCECGDGWEPIIRALCSYIQSYVDLNNKPQVEFTQVKEKFGGLRIYCEGSNEYIEGMISFAENEGYRTCEDCGTKEHVTVNKNGWIMTLCDKCRKEYWEKRGV